MDLFHEGEREVQRRAGVEDIATKVGEGNILEGLTRDFAEFLAQRIYLVAASRDADGRAWASLFIGPPGFARASGGQHLLLQTMPLPGDPLAETLRAGPTAIGLLAMESAHRIRIRVNGTATWVDEGVYVEVREAFGNCPKYIQRRNPTGLIGDGRPGPAGDRTGVLSDAQQAMVTAADTAFVASGHPERGADASHRGGVPGFIAVEDDGRRLVWGDYQGNNMFQTLGNLSVDPAIGVLVVDWESGRTLQISGRAGIVWEGERLEAWPGAQRLVTVDVEAVVEREQGFPVAFELVEPSRLNPPLPGS